MSISGGQSPAAPITTTKSKPIPQPATIKAAKRSKAKSVNGNQTGLILPAFEALHEGLNWFGNMATQFMTVAALIQKTKDGNAEVRGRSYIALSNFEDQRFVPIDTLIRGVVHPNGKVVTHVQRALRNRIGEIADKGDLTETLRIFSLGTYFPKNTHSVHSGAIELITALKSKMAAAVLENFYHLRLRRDIIIRRETISAIGELRDPRALPFLVSELKALGGRKLSTYCMGGFLCFTESYLLKMVAEAIYKIGGVDKAMAVFRDKDTPIKAKQAVIHALTNPFGKPEKSALSHLLKIRRSSRNPAIRMSVTDALEFFRGSRRAKRALVATFRKRQGRYIYGENARCAAVRSLFNLYGGTGDRRIAALRKRVSKSDPSPKVRRVATNPWFYNHPDEPCTYYRTP